MQKNNSDSAILEILREIPNGKVISYKDVAFLFSLHPRKIAKVMQSNKKQNEFPCYKIVRSDGSIGGYNLGIHEKIRRLNNDGIFLVDGKIPKDKFLKQSELSALIKEC